MEDWRAITEFPGYSVSTLGRVRNNASHKFMTKLRNQRGSVYVSLMDGNTQRKRGLSLLVANAFIIEYRTDAFDTVINLNGDRNDNRLDNLMWRPRWFAMRYFDQFERETYTGYQGPVVDDETGEYYCSTWEAATACGLLNHDVICSVIQSTEVWPTLQHFHRAAA